MMFSLTIVSNGGTVENPSRVSKLLSDMMVGAVDG